MSRHTRSKVLTVEELCHKNDDEVTLKDILLAMRDMKTSFEEQFQTLNDKIDGIKQEVDDVRHDVDMLLESSDSFPSNVSIIINNLPVEEDETRESLVDSVNALIEDGLELHDVVVRAAERIKPRSYSEVITEGDLVNNPARPSGPGIVKVRLASVNQKIACLRGKRKLGDTDRYARVYVNNCEDHASRLARLNMQTLLQELDKANTFFFTGSGRMVLQGNNDRGQGDGRRGGRGRGRGRGGHGRGRGDSRGGS